MDDRTFTQYQKIAEEVKNEKKKLSARQLRYLKKYAPKINVLCCKHKDKRTMKYQIGYIGLRCCKVAICLDCGEKQIICGKVGEFLLHKFIRKGITRVNILEIISTNDMFIYR